jgi:hypothetical protein
MYPVIIKSNLNKFRILAISKASQSAKPVFLTGNPNFLIHHNPTTTWGVVSFITFYVNTSKIIY